MPFSIVCWRIGESPPVPDELLASAPAELLRRSDDGSFADPEALAAWEADRDERMSAWGAENDAADYPTEPWGSFETLAEAHMAEYAHTHQGARCARHDFIESD